MDSLRSMTSGGDLGEALRELCRRGLLTCTSGVPGETGATYALGWVPLNDPDSYSQEVRRRHSRNMRALGVRP